MKRVLSIWIIGVAINILLLLYCIYLEYFIDEIYFPLKWSLINFLALSLIIGYFATINTSLNAKNLSKLLIVYLFLCLLSLYTRNFLPSGDDDLIVVYYYSLYILLPFQLFLIFLFFRLARLRNNLISYFKTGNREKVVKLIQKGRTLPALDLLLEESETVEPSVYKYLSLQRNTLTSAQRDMLASIIKPEDFRSVESKINKSLMEFL